MRSQTPRRRRRIIFSAVALMLLLAAGAVAYDLYFPRMTRMRDFDPDQIAHLETAMWRSYYEKRPVRLFNQMTELLRNQYKMTPVKSNVVAYYAARAAFVFKDGQAQSDYEKALPDLVKFYDEVRKLSDIQFDADRAARLELEW